jgi:formylglycine-generating enzyme required for sulfatase activity
LDSQTSRYYGLSVTLLTKYAWTQDNSEKRAWPVGMKKPNDFGLFDMHGDAWQWCDSGYAKYAMGSEGIAIDDAGNSAAVVDKASRVLRGGSFYFPAPIVRSAYRRRVVPPDRLYSLGFRAARTCP